MVLGQILPNVDWEMSSLAPVLKTIFHQCVVLYTCSQSHSNGSVLKTEPSELDWLQVYDIASWWKIVLRTGANLGYAFLGEMKEALLAQQLSSNFDLPKGRVHRDTFNCDYMILIRKLCTVDPKARISPCEAKRRLKRIQTFHVVKYLGQGWIPLLTLSTWKKTNKTVSMYLKLSIYPKCHPSITSAKFWNDWYKKGGTSGTLRSYAYRQPSQPCANPESSALKNVVFGRKSYQYFQENPAYS